MTKTERKQRGQCFICGIWVWTADPNGILIPLAYCREGYLFCEEGRLAKVTSCMRCEEDLMGGEKLDVALQAFITDFNGNAELKNPTKYENSKDHWYKQGVWIPVPWEFGSNEALVEVIEQEWAKFRLKNQSDKNTPVFSQYLNGANAFYQFLLGRLTQPSTT